jgi:pimeloyl-ACP methyl ester carboxylesterase
VTAALNLTATTVPFAAYTSNFTPDANETSDTIVWVHGWNVAPQRYEEQTQAMFKRLWWTHFKGRFASYHWPGTIQSTDDWWSIARTVVNALEFNLIDYRSYKYATGLKAYLASKAGGGNVYVIGHSLGCEITSEALREGAPMTKLVLMDAAVSASCYDTNLSDYVSAASEDDPDLSYHTDGTVNGGYRGYYQSIAAGKIVSFYNVADVGVGAWVYNNSLGITKGGVGYPGDPVTQQGGGYFYNPSNGDYSPTSSVFDYFFQNVHDPSTLSLRTVPDLEESMPFMAFSRSGPLGYEYNVGGPIGDKINMQAPAYFGASETGHSPQMDQNIQTGVIPFFQKIITEMGYPTPTNP